MTDIMNDLLQIYREDPYFKKVEEIFEKWKNHISHKKIVKTRRDIYALNLSDKFIMFPNILAECLFKIDFKRKDCFKLVFLIYKNIQRKNKSYLICKKMYLINQMNLNRMTIDRATDELKEKNILLVEKNIYGFKYILNLAPLSWNLLGEDKEHVEKEVEREIYRLQQKWIDEVI